VLKSKTSNCARNLELNKADGGQASFLKTDVPDEEQVQVAFAL